MIAPGQICRDRTRSTFKVVIVLGPSQRAGKLRVCRWQHSGERWSPPEAMFEHQLEPLSPDFDLTTRPGLVVSAARRSVVGGKVRRQVGPISFGERLTEIHYVGTVRA
jgi:hypothetical protein